MTGDRLRQVAMAVGALLLLWVVAEILRGGFDESVSDFELPAISVDAADSIVIRRATDTITLVKRAPEDWTVNGWRAAEATINEVFSALEEQPQGQLIAQSASTHGRLEIDEGTARTLLIYGGGKTLAHFLVGKRGRSFQDTYFRRPNEDNVYSVRTRLSSYIGRRLDDWRDRSVSTIEPDSVGSADIRLGRQSYTVRREEGGDGWVLSDGHAADSSAVATFLRQYRNLRATGFPGPEQRDSADFSRSERRAVLRDLQGEILIDVMFDSTAGAFWTRRDGDTTVYRISTFTVDRLTPADTTLRGG
ncbi:MAG: DUF4340 domain-containing protein [Gemmatimonadetes bacterium]|nr:DUF4340 domain-containing protein [Gemmatimonadota bacterium]